MIKLNRIAVTGAGGKHQSLEYNSKAPKIWGFKPEYKWNQ